jgi:two-component system, chemotaxis family, response regulator Rcp1
MSAVRIAAPEILLIDDNPGDARLVAEVLHITTPEAKLSLASDGLEGIRFLRHEGEYATAPAPDLILLDLRMPKKNGLEVLAEVKQDPVLRSIPVVVLTSSGAPQDIRNTYDLHANCFITKPIDLVGFLKIMQTLSEYWFGVVKLPRATSNGQLTD